MASNITRALTVGKQNVNARAYYSLRGVRKFEIEDRFLHSLLVFRVMLGTAKSRSILGISYIFCGRIYRTVAVYVEY